MAGTLIKISGPAFLANASANIFTPIGTSVDTVIRHIHVCNVTAGAITFTLYVGATGGSAAGTELFTAYSVAANSTYDWYTVLRLKSTQFLSGLASAATSLTITVEGELVANVP